MALFPPCNTTAAMMRKLLKKQGFTPEMRVTDKSRSHAAFKSEFGLSAHHQQGPRRNNRTENSHPPVRRREFKMQGSSHLARLSASVRLFRRPQHLQRQRHLTSHKALRVPEAVVRRGGSAAAQLGSRACYSFESSIACARS